MRLILKIAAVCLLAPTFLWAAPPQCQTGKLSDYIALGAQGCELAGVTYANFIYSGSSTGGAPVIQANQITVTPLTVVPATGNFTFAAPWSVNGVQSQTSKISYSAALPSDGTNSDALTLTLGTAQIGAIGSVTVTEPANVGQLKVFESCGEVNCQENTKDTLQFSGVLVVLFKQVEVDVVGELGVTSLDSFESSLNWCVPCV
jgi:hypothetical protein